MKSKFKVLFMPGTHAATCDRVVIFCSSEVFKDRKEENVQHRVCFVNVQSSLHENVVFSVSAHMCNAAYVIFIM